MKIFLIFIIFLSKNSIDAVIRDLSGLYDFEDCSCTVLRCLEPHFYRINQALNGDFTIIYGFNHQAAWGKTTSDRNGQQTKVSIRWTPSMDFDTNCTGLWVPEKRSIDLKCGDQYRYCTGQLKCRSNSGPCAENNAYSYLISSKIMISVVVLFLSIKKIN